MTELSSGLQIDESLLEQTRENREGLQWWWDEFNQNDATEGPPPSIAPSSTPISQAAFDLIVEFEVTSKQAYTQKYRRPTWPQGASGVTIGIGYDVGYVTRSELWADWKGAIPDTMIQALEPALGISGGAAKSLATSLTNSVDVAWEPAIAVHRDRVMPKWVALVERSLPNTGKIGPDGLGALVSLTYNRGASFSKDGDRYAEMRAIKQDMSNLAFNRVPGDLRGMKRLWPTLRGLQIRREREAVLFESGLSAVS